jgi:hypothetical protein
MRRRTSEPWEMNVDIEQRDHEKTVAVLRELAGLRTRVPPAAPAIRADRRSALPTSTRCAPVCASLRTRSSTAGRWSAARMDVYRTAHSGCVASGKLLGTLASISIIAWFV